MSQLITVVQKNKFYSVCAKEKISAGKTILSLQGIPVIQLTKYTVQIDQKKHLAPFSNHLNDEKSMWQFLNHSCNANSYFDLHKMELIALTAIRQHEEIRFNYCTTEYDMCSPFRCGCSAADCYGEIKGFRFLSEEEKKKLLPFLALHLTNIPYELSGV